MAKRGGKKRGGKKRSGKKRGGKKRSGKKRSRPPSQRRRGDHAEALERPPPSGDHAKEPDRPPPSGDHAEDFDLPPSTDVPFSAPWHGAPRDEFSRTAHLWPIELFEAFYGVLWKTVSKKDAKWARRFHAALMEQVMDSAGSVDEVMERLARFDYVQKPGRPKGSANVAPPLPLLRLYDPLLYQVQQCQQGRKQYAPDTLAALQRFWALWRRKPGLPAPRAHDFPTEAVQAALKQGVSPRDVASILVAAWFAVPDHANIPKYVQRARRALGLPG